MPFKTILVHLNDAKRAPSVLSPAIGLARKCNGHIKGLHAVAGAPPVPPLAVPYSGAFLDDLMERERKSGEEIKAAFETATAGQPVVAEFASVKVVHADIALAVLDHGRAADLIVTAQRDAAWDLAPILDFPERLALESGRPVLIVPHGSTSDGSFSTIVVGWNGKREAARAAFDALPLLREAGVVHVVSVLPKGAAESGTPVSALADALARHGIKVEVHREVGPERRAGEVLIARAGALGADLLVMGAYGHSRFREFVFGGVTRDIGADMRIPVLQSH